MLYIRIPYQWKEYVFHWACSFSIKSILEDGLIPGGKKSDKGRQTVFFTPLNPLVEKNSVMITQFLEKCTITVIGNVIKMPFIG